MVAFTMALIADRCVAVATRFAGGPSSAAAATSSCPPVLTGAVASVRLRFFWAGAVKRALTVVAGHAQRNRVTVIAIKQS